MANKSRGMIHLISIPAYPKLPRLSHSFDLKHSGNLPQGPGRVQSLAWTADGYCLAVGYALGWAAWSMGGRLGGWGVKANEAEGSNQEAFMAGVKEMAS